MENLENGENRKSPAEGAGLEQSTGAAKPRRQPLFAESILGTNPVVREVVSIAIIILVIFVLRSSIFNFYVIPTGSMIPTIKINDRVFANKLSYGLMLPFAESQAISWAKPQRGDIVLFQNPHGDTTFVKRVVGIEGDRLSFRDGRLLVNEKPVQEVEEPERSILSDQGQAFTDKFLGRESGLGSKDDDEHLVVRGRNSGFTFFDRNTYVVPPGKVFCMGDNRDGSNDSRFWGPVDANRIYGRALFILWSTTDPNVEGNGGFLPSFRWARFFQKLK
jgi:signal peptidase I